MGRFLIAGDERQKGSQPPSFLVPLSCFTRDTRLLYQVLTSKPPSVPKAFFWIVDDWWDMTSFVSCVHGHANLSCPNPSWFFPAFPKDPPWLWWILCNLAQLIHASLLDFLEYHLLLKPMTHASLCAFFFFLRPNTLFFSLHGPDSSILYFLEGQAFLLYGLGLSHF